MGTGEVQSQNRGAMCLFIQEELFGHQDRLEQKTEDKTKGKKRSDQKREGLEHSSIIDIK